MASIPDEKDGVSKEEFEQILLGLIKGIAEDPEGKNIPDYRDEIETDEELAVVVHAKLINGQDVVGRFKISDKDKDVFTLYQPMRLEMKPAGTDATSIRMAMELWSPFDTLEYTEFMWQHVISYGVVDPTVAEYHKWQWLYQSLYVKPSNKSAIGALNTQLAASLSKENLEWKDRLKSLKAAGKIIDYPDMAQ